MEVPMELREAAPGASRQQLRRQQGGSPPRRQQPHRQQPPQQQVGTEPAPAVPAPDSASALDLLSMLAASELATTAQVPTSATCSQPAAPTPAATLSAGAEDGSPWTALYVRGGQDEGELPAGNDGAAGVIHLPPAPKPSPLHSAAPPPPPPPPPFVAAVSNESAASSSAHSAVSSDGSHGSGSGSSTTSTSSGERERRRKRTAGEFIEEQERQTRRASSPSTGALTVRNGASASSGLGSSVDGMRTFRLSFPDGSAALAFGGGGGSGGSSDGSVNGRRRSGSASSSVARRMSTMMIFDPVTASGGLHATITGPGSPSPPPGLFPAVPVSRRFLQEATDRSIARGREGVMRGIQLLADGGVLDRQRAMDSLQLLQAMTLLSGRDVSVGVAPMIASLLAERPQAFVAHGRPSPPIASIFGRFTADESACYVISDASPSGQSVVTCNARMSELFMSTSEVQGLLAQVGTASVFIWGHFLCEQGAAELYAGVARCLLDPWVPPQIDIVVKCKTRHSAQLTCLASLAMRLNEHGRSVMVLRLLPLLHRTFGPVGPIPSGGRPRPPPPAVRRIGGRPGEGAAGAEAGRGRTEQGGQQQEDEQRGGRVGWGEGQQPQSSRPGRGSQASGFGGGRPRGRGECRYEAEVGNYGCFSSEGFPKRRRVLGAMAMC